MATQHRILLVLEDGHLTLASQPTRRKLPDKCLMMSCDMGKRQLNAHLRNIQAALQPYKNGGDNTYINSFKAIEKAFWYGEKQSFLMWV